MDSLKNEVNTLFWEDAYIYIRFNLKQELSSDSITHLERCLFKS